MNKNFISAIIAVVFTVALSSYAQDDMIVKGKIVYTKSMVDANLKSIKDIIIDGNKENGKTIPVHSTQIYGFTKTFDYFANFAEIEKVTGYSRDWFKEMKKALEAMWEPKSKMETALLNSDEKTASECRIIYETANKKFMDLMDHPRKAQKKK
ncbi:MAG: hypothetical protein WAX69_03090 [Victivallales bacterium]